MHALVLAALDPTLADALIEGVGALVLLVLSFFVLPWLRAQAGKTKSERVRTAALMALDLLDRAAIPAVRATEQTVAAKLRASPPAVGVLTAEQAPLVLADAVARVLEHYGPGKLDEIAKALGLPDTAALRPVIVSRIEAAVHVLRASQSPAPD